MTKPQQSRIPSWMTEGPTLGEILDEMGTFIERERAMLKAGRCRLEPIDTPDTQEYTGTG